MLASKVLVYDKYGLISNKIQEFDSVNFSFDFLSDNFTTNEVIAKTRNLPDTILLANIDFSISDALIKLQLLKRDLPTLKILLITFHTNIQICNKLRCSYVNSILSSSIKKVEFSKAVNSILRGLNFYSYGPQYVNNKLKKKSFEQPNKKGN